MENTFNINDFSKEEQANPATFSQCRGLSLKFANNKGKMNWQLQKRILGCLFGNAKKKKLTFAEANAMFNKNKLPAKYNTQIEKYIAQKQS